MKNYKTGFIKSFLIVIVTLLVMTGALYVYSNKKITESASITIISPNGGESWQEGKPYQIKWITKDISGDQVIKLVAADSSIIKTIATNDQIIMSSDGSYSYDWTPSNLVDLVGWDVKILVSTLDNSISDYSDNTFLISADHRGY